MSEHPFIHYSCQQIDEDDIAAVSQVLRSNFLTQGPAIEEFEAAISNCTQSPNAITVTSATAGLHLATIAMGITCGDLVWTTPMSFVATANSALYVGAKIDFVDIDPNTGNMCPKALAAKLASSPQKPKLVTVVHYTGRACNMEAFYALKNQYGFHLMEDASHALGAHYTNGKPIGSDPRTEAVVFSFHPVKPITTGEGGAITTHNTNIAKALRALRTHGITRDNAQLQQKNLPIWYYEQQTLGYNYRMNDIQAALGTSQIKKISHFISSRRALAKNYPNLLKSLPLHLPPADDNSGWHLYVVHIDTTRFKVSRDEVFNALREKNIGVTVHYMPIHLHPYYQKIGFKIGQFPKAEAFFAPMISLPLHPGLTPKDQERIAEALKEVLT